MIGQCSGGESRGTQRSRDHAPWTRLCPVFLQLFACTLGSEYEPVRVDAVRIEEDAGSEVLPASLLPQAAAAEAPPMEPERPSSEASASCADLSNVPPCELMLEELMPSSSAKCYTNLDCDSHNCSVGNCVAASCSDGILNQGESGTDCGGPCSGCAAGDNCRSSRDCAIPLSCVPATQRCASPSCQDGLQNGSETALDCGGTCTGCAAGSPCDRSEDCATGTCRDGVCATAVCDDLVRNQNETDTDCGGVCGSCAPGGSCVLDTDCQSGACQDGICCGGQERECTRCARRLATTLNCNSNGGSAETAAACTDFLQCLTDHSDSCPRRLSVGCTNAGGICDVGNFGGIGSTGIALADGIIGTAQCNF